MLIAARFHRTPAGSRATHAAPAVETRIVGDRPGRDEDAELVRRARAGDGEALESLLRGQYQRVYAVCRRMTGNDADAADAAQESLLGIVRGLPRFDEHSQFSTWVYRIAVNCSIDELRRRARRRSVSLDDDGVTSSSSLSGGGFHQQGDPEAAVERIDIDAAIRRLPPEFRAAVVLRDLCRLDYAEIAEVLEVPGGTVRSRIARGRGLLVGMLAPTGDER